MSVDCANACCEIIEELFGETVRKVVNCLFSAIARSVSTIASATNLSRNEVSTALSILIKYHLVTYRPVPSNPNIAEYSLLRDEIVNIIRYPRYFCHAGKKYGACGGRIVQLILHKGPQTCSSILLDCSKRADETSTLEKYRETLTAMVVDNYLIKLPMVGEVANVKKPVPLLSIQPHEEFALPEISLRLIMDIEEGVKSLDDAPDSTMFWHLNFKRFHQDFRDEVLIDAIQRKLGASAAECFQFMLVLMYEQCDPWVKQTSSIFTLSQLRHKIEKKSNNLELMKYLDQYVALIAEDSLGFIRKVGDAGGGEYIIVLDSAFEQLALSSVENIIRERFGSKAARIFRVILFKKYIEQEELQKEAMVPAKEAKLLSYNLFQEQFVHVKIIRRAGGGASGPAKAFYLFHVKLRQIVKMLLDICYKAVHNELTRSFFEKANNVRLMEKAQKLEIIVAAMRERGETEEYIADIAETLTPPENQILDKIKSRIETLSMAEIALDETIFVFQMYLFHC